MIGILLALAFFGVFGFYVYSIYTGAAASNIVGGLVGGTTGVMGVFLTGWSDMIGYLEAAASGVLGFAGWLLVLGFVAMILVMLYNGLRTANHDMTLVQ